MHNIQAMLLLFSSFPTLYAEASSFHRHSTTQQRAHIYVFMYENQKRKAKQCFECIAFTEGKIVAVVMVVEKAVVKDKLRLDTGKCVQSVDNSPQVEMYKKL